MIAMTMRTPNVCLNREEGDAVASLNGVFKHYRGIDALRDVSFSVPRVGITALLGTNGAGKTTVVNLLAGLTRPDRGSVRVFAQSPFNLVTRLRVRTTPQASGFPGTLTVWEIIDFVAAHYDARKSAESLLDEFGLTSLRKRMASTLSGGEMRRLSIALAFVGKPSFVLLDEPTTGLDVQSRTQAWHAVSQFVEKGGSVLLTTHYLEEAQQLADSIIILHRGSVVSAGGAREIVESVGMSTIRYIDVASGRNVQYSVRDADAEVRRLVTSGVGFHHLAVESAKLDDVFTHLVGGDSP